MANTKDITSANSNILLVGDAGTHKTFFLGTVPGLYVFDFDGGMSILRSKSIEYDTFKDVPPGVKVTPKMTKELGLYEYGSAWPAFFKKLQDIGQQIDAGKGPKALAFDSLTFMSMIAVGNILKSTGHDLPHQGTWGAHHEYFKRVFGQITAWPVRIIATVHIQRDENDITKATEKLPLLAGKMAGLIGTFFDEVYFCDSKVEGGKPKFTISTTRTPQMTQAKSRWGVPDSTETSFEAISKYFGDVPSFEPGGGTVKELTEDALKKAEKR